MCKVIETKICHYKKNINKNLAEKQKKVDLTEKVETNQVVVGLCQEEIMIRYYYSRGLVLKIVIVLVFIIEIDVEKNLVKDHKDFNSRIN